jgi:enoyl-CoA hydratase/carnithine racemase
MHIQGTSSMTDHIRYDLNGGIATITIDRPEKKNAMTFAVLGEFIEAVRRAGADADARVVIVTGVPGAFCAGTDLSDLATVPGAQRGLRGTAEERDRWWPLVECPKPVIAAVDGPAVGMGAEFTSQCDIRLATPNARFAWNFAHRGLVPDTGAGSWLLPRLIGPSRALRLLYTGEFLSAQAALEIGYVDELVAPEALIDKAHELAGAILRGSPFSHSRIKQLVYEGLGGSVAEHMARHTSALEACFRSNDHKEGVAAFLERREANFTGT